MAFPKVFNLKCAKSNGFSLFVKFAIVFILFSCNRTAVHNDGCAKIKKNMMPPCEVFYEEVKKIGDEYALTEGYIEFPFALFNNEKFKNIIDSVCFYKACLIEILRDEKKEKKYKWVSLYALQHLCINDYIQILDVVYLQYKANKIDSEFLMTAIIQSGFSLEVIKNYNNDKLKKLLLHIIDDGIISANDKETINSIIAGEKWKKDNYYYENYGRDYYPWLCK